MFGFDKKELNILRKLNTPRKIQDFLEELEINFEENGDTCKSPRVVLKTRKAHCVEGAMLAATILRINGYKPLVVDLTSNKKDYDHVVAVFKQDGLWGAISKTNHASLKYRDPIYKSIRELVLSYFNEYFLDSGKKTLRSYSMPVDLSRFDKLNWVTSKKDVWFVPEYLGKIKHIPIVNKKQIFNLRKAETIEIEAGRIIQWKKDGSEVIKNEFKVDKEDKAQL